MQNIKTLITSLILGSVLLTSCGIGLRTTRSARSASFMPNDVRLNVTMDDYQYLGTQEVSVSYKKYLGLFTFYNEINGKETTLRNINLVNLSGPSAIGFYKLDFSLFRALYVAMVNHPDADFVVPVSLVTEKEQMFLGSNVKKTLKVKIYKIKEK
ncbi:MAG: hypothetical protein HY840_06030 [Bacteroidetes bacterium]|nr:hypothetical protein [Bacteroidota bacterium]